MMVTGALSEPIMMSPPGPAWAKSSGEGSLSAAIASVVKGGRTPAAAPSASTALAVNNSRRVSDTECSWLADQIATATWNFYCNNVALARQSAKSVVPSRLCQVVYAKSGYTKSGCSSDRSPGSGAGSFFRCNQKRLSWAMDSPQPVAAAEKIDRRQIVMHGAAVSAAALTLLPKFATAYTDAARSAEPLLIAVPEILPDTPDEGEIARGMTQVVIDDLWQIGRFALVDPAAP